MKPLFACLLGLLVLSGCSEDTAAPSSATGDDQWAAHVVDGVIQLQWEDLIPAGGNPETLYDKVSRTPLLTPENDDPISKTVLAAARAVSSRAPVVESLNGKRVHLAGLVVPLESDGEKMSEFLMVPYFGACIHVPPPPSNQIVHVKTGPQKTGQTELFGSVQVTGLLRTEYISNDAGDAGYLIEAEKVEPYQ